MFIPLPNLDDRRWADLTEEGRALIPLYAPEWTDHNTHDPGITQMEMLAWVAEMDLFQLNRIPDSHRLKFLALVGVKPEPPSPARTVLAFSLNDNAPLAVARDARFVTANSAGDLVQFRTARALDVLPGNLAAVASKSVNQVVDLAAKITHGDPAPLFGAVPLPDTHLYLGFTAAPPAGSWISLYFTLSGPRANDAVPAAAQHQSVQLAWEALDNSNTWRALEMEDETRSLTLNGPVRLRAAFNMHASSVPGVGDNLCFVRVRIAAGIYDAPPIAANIAFNAVAAEQADVQRWAHVADRDGGTAQTIQLKAAPLLPATLRLMSIAPGARYRWTERADFDTSGRTDRHFLLDPTTGVIRFGDGEHGLAPPAGEELYVRYRSTLAESGNLNAGRVFHPDVANPKLAVTNPIPATGGAAAETVEHACGRAVMSCNSRTRAVTAADYEVLALETPGTELARAAAIPNFHPAFECLQAQGIITVIVVPNMPVAQPWPSPGTRELVARHLDRRRMVGTRVEVVAPRYVPVSILARVRALAGASATQVRQRVVDELNAFLNPLTGGPDGTGWPFGRDVYRSEILQVIDGVEGVDYVASLDMQTGGCSTCGNICVRSTWLATYGTHSIEVIAKP
jgi:predicted phage baseplate assembly protein